MANATLAVLFLALLVLVQVSGGVARHHQDHDPDPCGESVPLRHREKDPRCSTPGGSAKGGTPAIMTVNGFQKGEEGGDPSECDGKFHSDSDMVTALSTRWYAGGKRCHKPIRITSVKTGRTVVARVVDECDSRRGCKTNIVDTSKAVWKALGLDTEIGEVPVTWSDA